MPVNTECPEEVIDNRTLFDRLQQQKDKKEEDYAEQHKLSEYRNILKLFII